MPTIKLKDFTPLCRDPDHDPPKYQVFDNGVYQHTCSACGKVVQFVIVKPSFLE